MALALTGCIVVPADPYYGPVMVAPPVPRVEVIGAAPYPGYFWTGGYWSWVGHRHVWVPGYWAAPRPGYRWAPHAWRPYGGGWRAYPGRWHRG
jgi:hypothetical protein